MPFVRSEILQHMDDRCSSICAINTLEELDEWHGEQEAEALVDEHGAPAAPPAQLAQHAQPAAGPPPAAQLQAKLLTLPLPPALATSAIAYVGDFRKSNCTHACVQLQTNQIVIWPRV